MIKRSQSFPCQDIERAKAIEPILELAQKIEVYSEEISGCFGLQISIKEVRIFLLMSPSRTRGFSGEGHRFSKMISGLSL